MLRIPDSGFLLREFRLGIRHFHIDQFLLGIIVVPREIENNGYAKSWGVDKMYMVYVKMVNSRSKMFQDFGIVIIRHDAN